MPNIPIVPPSIKPATLKAQPASKVTYPGTRILPGGMQSTHTGNVLDNSADKAQYLPYVANCLTCGWQSRQSSFNDAEYMIKSHVGSL